MSIKILAPIDVVTAVDLEYNATGTGVLLTNANGIVSESVFAGSGPLYSESTGFIPKFNLSTTSKLLGSVDHTSATATNYTITVSNGEYNPFLSYVAYISKQVSAAAILPTLRCGYNGGTIDSGTNYRRRMYYHNGSALTTLAQDVIGIQLGYAYSNVVSDVTQNCLVSGHCYIKSGAQRLFTHRTLWTNTTVSSYNTESNCWVNTANELTNIQVVIPANTFMKFWLYQRD